jgi:hypothetical protein
LSHFTLMFSCLWELISVLCSLHATVTIIGSCVDKFVNSLSNVQYFFILRLFSTK